MEKKPQSIRELATIAEQYSTDNMKLLSRDLNSKKSACAPRLEVKSMDNSFVTGGKTYYKCGKSRQRAIVSTYCVCKIRVKKSIATGAGDWSYFYAMRGKNRLSRGGSNLKKAYKVGCAMPVKRFRFNTMEVDKLKEKKCKVISDNKKNTNKNPKNYPELKHGKKI